MPQSPDRERRSRDLWILLGLLAGFFASRGVWFLTLPDSSFYWEEAYRLVAVHELATAPVRPFGDYRADHYQGGSLVAIAVARALAFVTGVESTTLKLAALVFSGGTLAMLFLLVRRFFGREAAVLAGLAYLCGPPLVAFWGLCLMGFHSESLLPSLGLVYLTLLLGTQAWGGRVAWFSLGALATLCIWFTPSAALAVAACGLSGWMLRGVPPPRDVAWGAAGAAVGFLPWLAYNAPRGWPGLARLIEVFGAEDREEFLAQGLGDRVLELLARVPSEGLLDPGGDLVGSPWRLLLFVGVLLPAGLALLVGALRMLRMARRWRSAGVSNDPERLELVFWLYGLLFAAVYLVSRFTLEVEPTPIAYRLMVPPAVFLLVPLAISAARGLRARGWQRAVAAAGVGLALSSLAASTTLFALRHHGDGLPTTFDRGYLLVGHLALRKYPRSVQRAVAEVRPVRDARNRRAALRGVAWGLVEDYEHGGASLEGLQRGVMSLHEPDRTQVWRNVESIAAFRRGELVRAYGRTGDASFANAMQRIDRLLALFPIRRDAGSPAEDGLAPVSGLR